MNAIHDTLRLANRRHEFGLSKEQAESIVSALNEELAQGVATKVDLNVAVADLKTASAEFKAVMARWIVIQGIAIVCLTVALVKILP